MNFVTKLKSLLQSNKISNKKLDKVIRDYSFYEFSDTFDFDQNKQIIDNIKESQIIIINQFKKEDNEYLILSFKRTLIFVNQNSKSLIESLLSNKSNLSICFIFNTKQVFDQNYIIKYTNIEKDLYFEKELESFNKQLSLYQISNPTWDIIKTCISGYLIKQSYFKMKRNRISEFFKEEIHKEIPKEWKKEDFVELRIIGEGSIFCVYLIYSIEKEEIFAIKKPRIIDNEIPKLIKREVENYSKINYPLVPRFYGTIKNDDSLIIEYINGQTLKSIKELTNEEKILIIFGIMVIIDYFHLKEFILRDIKPDNIIIMDDNKTVVMIDFDRMIQYKSKVSDHNNNDDEFSKDLGSQYVDPEVTRGNFSYANDIYSLGKIINYIKEIKEIKNGNSDIDFTEIDSIYNKCFKEFKQRPDINSLILEFCNYYFVQIEHSKYLDFPYIQGILGYIYINNENIQRNVSKAIQYLTFAANNNDIYSINNLGVIYYDGKHVERDISKAISYLTQASDQNFPYSQLVLGFIYLDAKYVERDINKSIHYFTLAANNNNLDAQIYLGSIYYDDKYVERDINKAIHYLTLAADQNDRDVQFHLGSIYFDSKYVERDINKAIHYLTLAADQNNIDAQYKLGSIYFDNKYVERDINKAIHYLTLAADQNNIDAQLNLGIIYENGLNIKQDIKKAIHYLSLAANQNNPRAQYFLGCIYINGKYIERDINRAIQYLTMAAIQNHMNSQFKLGMIYFGEKKLKEAVHYFQMAANQNDNEAQFFLDIINNKCGNNFQLNDKSIQFLSSEAKQKKEAQYFLEDYYYKNKSISGNINKAIYYLKLAADQNYPIAQYELGFIYYRGIDIPQNINKSIHYLTLAANQNNEKAQCFLGIIYYENKYIKRSIENSIHYLTLAMNQKSPDAELILGYIYSKEKYCERNICKLFKIRNQAENENDLSSQFFLGMIYYNNEYASLFINKAIYYFTLAAKQNDPKSLFLLGSIYSEGKYVLKHIPKAINYFDLAANQNDPEVQFLVGYCFYIGNNVPKNIFRSIHYFTLAAKLNHFESQFHLGLLFYNDIFAKHDINKSIYYLTLASDLGDRKPRFNFKNPFYNFFRNPIYKSDFISHNNNPNDRDAQTLLGCIYYENKYIQRDIKKAIHYFTLAANRNQPEALSYLGFIYFEGKFVPKNLSKALNYFTLAADQNNPTAQYNLGYIYLFTFRNIKKAIHYFTLAANQNDRDSQFFLGTIYLNQQLDIFNKNKGIDYLYISSKNGHINAYFSMGFLYHQGKYIKRDIKKAIHYYKEASSFNFIYAKNNLGIIYKYGFSNEIEPNLGISITYFEEACRHGNDIISIYNLSHIYLYYVNNFDKSIENLALLISINNNFYHSYKLLCLALIKKCNCNLEEIKKELNKQKLDKIGSEIIHMIEVNHLHDKNIFIKEYKYYKKIDFLYDHLNIPIISTNISNLPKIQSTANITKDFYNGFGIDLCSCI